MVKNSLHIKLHMYNLETHKLHMKYNIALTTIFDISGSHNALKLYELSTAVESEVRLSSHETTELCNPFSRHKLQWRAEDTSQMNSSTL